LGFASILAVLGMVPSRQATAQCTGCSNASFAGAPRLFDSGDRLYDLVAADFDRDGFLDVCTANRYVGGPVLLSLGDGRGGLAKPIPFPTDKYPQALETADFNRDGFPDVAFTFENSPTVGVMIGGATGRFGPVVEYSTGAGTHPRDLVAADFNGDAVSDLAVMNDYDEGIAVLLATGSGGFGAPTPFTVGNSPRAIAAADLNADGKIDLAVTNVSEQVVSILLGIGNGSFAPRTTYALPPSVTSIAVGHFDGDAHSDLAVSGGGFVVPAATAILAGNGNGGFGSATVIAPIATSRLDVLDYNRDGRDDLAALWSGVTLLAGNGNGTFQAPFTSPIDGTAFAKGDFNSDGWLDFVVARQNSTSIRTLAVLLGNSSGLGRVPGYPGAFDPRAMAIGDFNHDGRSDVALADNSFWWYPAGMTSVLLSLPDGSLAPPATYATVIQPTSIRTADFNGDGHLDLASANSTQVSILLGTGNGGFSSATNFPLGTSVSAIDTADFNSDGNIDLVFSSFYDNAVTILFGDGAGAFGSPLTHPVSFPSPPVTGDFNSDGNADVAMAGYRILYGDGAGHFGEVVPVAAGVSVQKFVVADFNGDGRSDLAGIGVTDGGAVVLSLPTGGFGTPLPFPVEFDAYVRMAPSPGDFDLDGKLDLAVLSGGYVSVLRGNGNGTFSSAGNLFVAFLVSDVVTADFNADGRPDLAGIRSTAPDTSVRSDVSVLLNTNCQPRRLAVTRNPSVCNLPNAPFEIQPVVKLYDDGDNVVSCVGGTVQAAIVPGTGAPGADLEGTTAAPLAAGAAFFGDLSVNAAGDGYLLQFTRIGVIPVRSRLFRVDPACKGPFAFYTVPPCRVLDTRNAAGPWGGPALAGGSLRRFDLAGKCAIPATARSVAANLTAVTPGESGYLTLFPAGRSAPLASSINFRPGIVRANNAVLALGDSGDIDVFCGMPAGSNVDFVLDVVGYFR
jgi:hypothetical protein